MFLILYFFSIYIFTKYTYWTELIIFTPLTVHSFHMVIDKYLMLKRIGNFDLCHTQILSIFVCEKNIFTLLLDVASLPIIMSRLDSDQYFKSSCHPLFLHFDCIVQRTQLPAIYRHKPTD